MLLCNQQVDKFNKEWEHAIATNYEINKYGVTMIYYYLFTWVFN